ncbi:isopenicillin N synthase family dioxygenase [Candidatus Litorirhabdus singularis]|nr:2OG-Fe(II) oxygenase family protein [Candidatus Litorirhabdus singularis]
MNTNIPVIDLKDIGSRQTLHALDEACRHWGLFQVVGHGIKAEGISAVHDEMRNFFAQPQASKLAISRSQENPWGYYDQERTGNEIDRKQVFDYGPADGATQRPQWPHQAPGFKSAMLEHYAACERLAFVFVEAIGHNLGAKPGLLLRSFQPSHTSFLRLNYFPGKHGESAATESALGINPHTDSGAVTVLSLDQVAGLEVFVQEQWVPVAAQDDALVINLGDVVQVWSNDRYRAPLHRVAGSGNEARYSAPFFLNPAYSANYEPLHSTVDKDHPPRYHTINWGRFRELRTLGDYDDYGEEVRLSQYLRQS